MNNNLRSRQLNPCDHLFWKSRGYSERPDNWREILINAGWYDDPPEEEEEEYEEYEEEEGEEYNEYDDEDEEEEEYDEEEEDDEVYDYDTIRLRSLQNNPNNIEYWRCRGWSYRPDDWYGGAIS